jgi:chromosome segregation ATPase
MDEELAAAQARIEELEGVLDDANDEIVDLKRQNDELREANDKTADLQKRLDELQNTYDDAYNTLEEIETMAYRARQ